MSGIKLDLKYTNIKDKEIMKYKDKVEKAHNELHEMATKEDEFAGWLTLPTNYDKEEFDRIKKAADKI